VRLHNEMNYWRLHLPLSPTGKQEQRKKDSMFESYIIRGVNNVNTLKPIIEQFIKRSLSNYKLRNPIQYYINAIYCIMKTVIKLYK
jgi:hypothetical protein